MEYQKLFNLGRAHASSACLLKAALENKGLDWYTAENSVSVHYLLCLGVELMMKSWPSRYDKEKYNHKFLKEFSHDLKLLKKECYECDFPDIMYFDSFIQWYANSYKRDTFRYTPVKANLPSDFDQIVRFLEDIEHKLYCLA